MSSASAINSSAADPAATLDWVGSAAASASGTAALGDDQPWRGFSLDIARSFYPLPVLLRLVDRLAELKLNVFHLHLTDDQGWRIEIPGHPELTDRSGGTAVAGGQSGFLMVADWQALVTYAHTLGIMVVPEIDVPGHTNAALHAIAALNPDGQARPAYDGVDVGFSQLHADLPATKAFLEDVFQALAAMTPGPWIHIGGDECHAMTDEEYTQIVRLVVDIVEQTGKRPIAWQEGALAGLGERLRLQFWLSV
ncbi:MAG: family 20 glycosylhydrolase, partial [Propionibacteriaceae bacterium]|nr:family 20 glycosylhydrolase [Propionibacteriaceae bacterium]